MALSAAIETGLLPEAQRAAAGITGEIREQVSLLERAVALERRMGGGPRAPVQPGPRNPLPAWTWTPASSANTATSTGLARDTARTQIRSVLDEEIRRARYRAPAEAGMSLRQASTKSRALLGLLQGQRPTVADAKDLGEIAIGAAGGKRMQSRMAALAGAAATAAPLYYWASMAFETFKGAHDLGIQFGAAQGKLDARLQKSFHSMDRRAAVELGARLNEIADPGRLTTFERRLTAATAARARMQQQVIEPILAADPTRASVALNAALSIGNNGNLERRKPHTIWGRPGDVEAALKTLIAEGRGDVMATAADLVKGIATQEKEQRRLFADDPAAAAAYHDRIRTARRLEKREYEDRQRDWGNG